MLVTYCAVKLMEIFNRKNNFSDLREVSVLGHLFFWLCL
jgi:hypothetical protein